MSAGRDVIPQPSNEPVRGYAPGSAERASLQAAVTARATEVVEIPCVLGGEHVFTGNTQPVTMPCDHGHVIANVHMAGPAEVKRAIDASLAAKAEWAALPFHQRAAVLLRGCGAPRRSLAGPCQRVVHAGSGQDLLPV